MDNNELNGTECKLGEFFQEYKVVIPVLQRDYAQGRKDKTYIRESFLKEIKEVVDGSKKTCNEDFVYGYFEGNEFFPLDGQQRLTTLWLVYWYIALRAQKLEEERESLSHFSYETRKTTREFCEAICDCTKIHYTKSENIVDYIKNQTWFFETWTNDPTINSMLRMLGGTNADDGIERVLGDLGYARSYDKALKRLKENVYFYLVTLGDEYLPKEVADQLYVKMNARGKALNDFENFRADFINQLSTDDELNQVMIGEKKLFHYISERIDKEWGDIFWRACDAGNGDGKIDELFFSLIHRFCLNRIIIKKDVGTTTKEEYILSKKHIDIVGKILDTVGSEKEESDVNEEKRAKKAFENLSKYEIKLAKSYLYFKNDTQINYEKYDLYTDVFNREGIQSFINIMNGIQMHQEDIDKAFTSHGYAGIIPSYELDSGKKVYHENKSGIKVGNVNAKDNTYNWKVYFHAVCVYFDKIKELQSDYNKDMFEEWMRVAYNIIHNTEIGNVADMISCVRLINKLGEGSDNIIVELAKRDIDSSPSSKMAHQENEEIQKAKRWNIDKEKIKEAEKWGFTHGSIRFLFTDQDGKENWNHFDTKFKKLKEYFPDGKKADFDFVKTVAESYEGFNAVNDKMIFHTEGRQVRNECWYELFCDGLEGRIHKLLLGEVLPVCAKGKYRDFLNSDAFKVLVTKKSDDNEEISELKNLRVFFNNNIKQGKYALYKKSAQQEKMYFDDDNFKRNELLSELSRDNLFCIDTKHIVCQKAPYFFGEVIYFKYKDKRYKWTIDDEIYEYDDTNNHYSKRVLSNVSGLTSDKIKEKMNNY